MVHDTRKRKNTNSARIRESDREQASLITSIMYAPRPCTTCKVLKFYREDMHEDVACIFAKQNKRERSESLIYVGEDKRRLCFCRELIQRWKTLITLSRRTMAALWYARERKNRRGRAQLISIIRGNSRMQVKANRSA